ncbi:MAG: O-antigen ligase family protein [Gaiellaceae bacterium]
MFYPLVLALTFACLVTWLRRREPIRVDLLDLALLLFVIWQLIAAAAAPVGTLAWFGAYNRIGGAFLWLALGLLLFLGRRVFSEPRAVKALIWVVCGVICLSVGVATLQTLGVDTPWPYRELWYGRVIGTTGNPLNLAGLCLLGIWLASLMRSRTPSHRLRGVIVLAVVLSALGLVFSLSRAAYLGIALAAVLIGAMAIVARWWRVVVPVGTAIAILAGAALVFQSSSPSSGTHGRRLSLNPRTTISAAVGDTRAAFWRIGLRATADRPLLGYGPGGYLVAYRRFVPAKRMQNRPLSGVTDPHSMPLLIADGSGLPGLGLALLCLAFAARLTWPRLKRDLGSLRAGERLEAGSSALGSSACTIALLGFLAISPTDPAALVPLALMVALSVGAPRIEDRFAIDLPHRTALRGTEIVAAAATSVALLISLFFGVQLLRADHSAKQATAAGGAATGERSAKLMPSVSTYNLIAWNANLRLAEAAGNDRDTAASGERFLRQGLKDDPSDPMLRVALVRYEFMFSDAQAAAGDIETGLHYNPTNPLLQGLLGYLAQALAHDPRSVQPARQLTDELSALEHKNADGWYWLSVAQAALNEKQAASRSLAEANRLAPGWGRAKYLKRIRGEF